jgi:acyl-CoA thioesterase I
MNKISFILILFLCFPIHAGESKSMTVLYLGDSLTDGYGVSKEVAYPQLVQVLFQKNLGREMVVLNGSVSGSTTASGLSRLRWFLKRNPDVLVLALGANDGLRGLSLEESKKNLNEIIVMAKEAKIQVVLAGMLMPANYGEDYRTAFTSMFQDLVNTHKIHFIPFLLEGVATIPELNQADGIHPNEKGHEIMAKTVFEALKGITF